MKQAIKTENKVQKEKRNAALKKERAELLSIEGAMPVAVDAFLTTKYGVSRAQIWRIINDK